MRLIKSLIALTLTLGLGTAAYADSHGGKPVGITPDLMSVTVNHNGKEVEIKRNQDNDAVVIPAFAKTSRPCPPFCIQPMVVAPGVETIGEAEVIDYIAKMSAGDSSIFLGDSRTPDWVAKGTIPGAVNVSWTSLVPAKGATTEGIIDVMAKNFGVKLMGETDAMDVDEAITDGDTSKVFDYSGAKTLVLFCNGMWCGQSPASIKTLLKYGYPAEKIKYFRGGMQTWEILGLSTAKP
ncbi:rhodanese-like domain-containing protein [Leucothrix pacifica]|uniref:Sulfurtransferase n=1 Tax=Leucothrix pacifica TaxID=1247513 RepID=A0A317C3Y9_9GAMM|nr:rhodanese-like domain-containing protein [Leucothrix pacifica]PWQ93017.1 sulfurtransferase [Leucothrix pacifica]